MTWRSEATRRSPPQKQRHPESALVRSIEVAIVRTLRIVAAVAIALGGFVHLRIWQHEYRHAPVREMFMANWLLSAVIAALLLGTVVLPRALRRMDVLIVMAGLTWSIGTLAAFALSRGPGLPTLHGSFKEHGLETTASYVSTWGSAKVTLVTETVAAIVCAASLNVSVRARAR